mgnify:CR=1 FL=1
MRFVVSLLSRLLLLLLLLLLTAGLAFATANNANACHWASKPNDPIIYYINMDSSKMRRHEMELQLTRMGVRYERFAGIGMAQIHIPEDLVSTWNTKQARFATQELDYNSLLAPAPDLPTAAAGTPYIAAATAAKSIAYLRGTAGNSATSSNSAVRVVVTGLYGRRRTNRLAELGCTISHVLAMHRAIYSDLQADGTHSQSRYAVITEDDVLFPFDIDWSRLAASAPAGFGMLQLFNRCVAYRASNGVCVCVCVCVSLCVCVCCTQ